MVYLAEFALVGKMELVDEILICADSEQKAQYFALNYASNWGIALHSLSLATDRHRRSVTNPYNWQPKSLSKIETPA